MKKNIIHFPKFREIEKLCTVNKIDFTLLSNEQREMIYETILNIRRKKGAFNQSHFKAILKFLEFDWLPQDIPILLP
jgi:hypothetical protein